MTYTAKVYTVMIASPNDVVEEREIVRDIIYEWNAIHSAKSGIVLLPAGWETHTSPEMGGRPQEFVNSQVVDKCDLLVGVFWTRLGTPTGEHASGTVEEIDRLISNNKPAMLYFSKKPVVPDSIDTDQLNLLKNFRDSCRQKGYCEEYDDIEDFKSLFYRHLQLKINEHEIFLNNDVESSLDEINAQPLSLSSKTTTLSFEAKSLLKEASLDVAGRIMHLSYIGGASIQTNGKNFVENGDRREVAKWEAAIAELLSQDLVVEKGYKGEVFDLTSLGYQVADNL